MHIVGFLYVEFSTAINLRWRRFFLVVFSNALPSLDLLVLRFLSHLLHEIGCFTLNPIPGATSSTPPSANLFQAFHPWRSLTVHQATLRTNKFHSVLRQSFIFTK